MRAIAPSRLVGNAGALATAAHVGHQLLVASGRQGDRVAVAVDAQPVAEEHPSGRLQLRSSARSAATNRTASPGPNSSTVSVMTAWLASSGWLSSTSEALAARARRVDRPDTAPPTSDIGREGQWAEPGGNVVARQES